MGVLSTCMSVHHAHTMLMEPEEVIGAPQTGVTEDFEQLSGCLELYPGLYKNSKHFQPLSHLSSLEKIKHFILKPER